MTDTTTAADTGSTTTAAAATPQNYILYRTKAVLRQPEYTYLEGETPVVPAVVTDAAQGLVVVVQSLTGLDGIITPDGFAYAPDAAGAYPVGSIYTPPTAGGSSSPAS